jgi:hypothetical protein
MNFIPNPTTGNTQLTIIAPKQQEIKVDFYDMLRRLVMSEQYQLTTGTNVLNFDLRRFSAATYQAVVTHHRKPDV